HETSCTVVRPSPRSRPLCRFCCPAGPPVAGSHRRKNRVHRWLGGALGDQRRGRVRSPQTRWICQYCCPPTARSYRRKECSPALFHENFRCGRELTSSNPQVHYTVFDL